MYTHTHTHTGHWLVTTSLQAYTVLLHFSGHNHKIGDGLSALLTSWKGFQQQRMLSRWQCVYTTNYVSLYSLGLNIYCFKQSFNSTISIFPHTAYMTVWFSKKLCSSHIKYRLIPGMKKACWCLVHTTDGMKQYYCHSNLNFQMSVIILIKSTI